MSRSGRAGGAAALSIIDALKDANLFGGLPVFRDLSTWRPWLEARSE